MTLPIFLYLGGSCALFLGGCLSLASRPSRRPVYCYMLGSVMFFVGTLLNASHHAVR